MILPYKNGTPPAAIDSHGSVSVLNALVYCCRDPTELQKPTSVNTPVVRFYRYIQAARDGQEAKDCLRLYPACSLATE